VRSLVSGSR